MGCDYVNNLDDSLLLLYYILQKKSFQYTMIYFDIKYYLLVDPTDPNPIEFFF